MSHIALVKHLTKLLNSTDNAILARGRSGLEGIDSFSISSDDDVSTAQAQVMGTRLYTVQLGESNKMDFCSCPYFDSHGSTCKHMVSVALHALAELKKAPTLSRAISETEQRVAHKESLRAIKVAKDEELYYQIEASTQVPYAWALIPFLASLQDQQLTLQQKLSFAYLRNRRTVKLTHFDKNVLELFPPTFRSFSATPETPRSLMSMLKLFRGTGRLRSASSLLELAIAEGIWTPKLVLSPAADGGAVLNPILVQEQIRMDTPTGAKILGLSERFLLTDEMLYVLDTSRLGKENLNLFTHSTRIEKESLAATIPSMLARQEYIELPDEYQPKVVQGNPNPTVILEYPTPRGTLAAKLIFAYPPSNTFQSYGKGAERILCTQDDGSQLFLLRDKAQEERDLEQIETLMRHEDWKIYLRNDALQIEPKFIQDFFAQVLDPLIQDPRWSMRGLDSVKRFQKYTGKIRLNVSSGVDWFDLEGKVEFGAVTETLGSILKLAANADGDEITLSDGSRGILPRNFLRLLRIIQGLQGKEGQGGADGLHISAMHQSVLQPFLDGEAYHIEGREKLRQQLESKSFVPLATSPPPKKLQATLRPYQEEGLHWLRQMRAWGTGGILADDMGLGKTVQVIAALCDFYASTKEQRPSLIVLPTSLLHNWLHEIERFAPHLKILLHHGQVRKTLDATLIPARTIVITSYAILRTELAVWTTIKFGYAILDESQAIKNPMSQAALCARTLVAAHRLAMTGTPIENSLMDLWSQFSFVSPGLLGGQEFFRREFVEPLQDEQRGATAMNLLGRVTAPFYLRRTKEKVLLDLPPLEERVLYVDMGTAQRAFYNKTRDHFRKEILGNIKTKGVQKSQINIIEGMLRLRQIACDPRLYEPDTQAPSAKLELLVEKLREDVVENHKALVFSQFTTLLDYCGKALDAENIPFAYLDGSTRDRAKAIEEFTSQSEKRVFLISLKAGGTGLNLTCADYVFHLDPWWNPAVEAQATGRAYRMGQKNAVQSIKLVASNTIEEKILQLQENKRKLASAVLQSDHGFVKSLDADLVRELFS